MSNAIVRGKKIDFSSIEELSTLCVQLNTLKMSLEKWKRDLPPYYNPITLPTNDLEFDDPEALIGYPYGTRHGYIARMHRYTPLLILSACWTYDELIPICSPRDRSISVGRRVHQCNNLRIAFKVGVNGIYYTDWQACA